MRFSPKKFLILSFTTAIGLAVVGATYQQMGEARDLERYPAPGDLVNVDGVQLHLHCEGRGSPAVVVEAGHGNYSVDWIGIQDSVSSFTRICLYDRAGSGWSDFDPKPPTREHVAESLRELLWNANVDAPFVLVGHSLGGIYVREFARQFPDDVVGLVLVDSAHENQIKRAELGSTSDPLAFRIAMCRLLSPVGIVRVSGVMNNYISPETPDENRPGLLAAMNRTHFCSATRLARDALVEELSRGELLGLPQYFPTMVLTRGLPENPDDRSAEAVAWESLWLKLQTEIAVVSVNSDRRIVEDAGHFIHHDQPDVVVAAIQEIVARSR